MKTKRIIAYIIDFFIISFLSTAIFSVAFKNTSYPEYMEKSKTYLNELLHSGSTEFTEDDLNNIVYDLQKTQTPLAIITLGLTVLYFGIISFLFNGRTLGKKIMKIQVVPMKGKRLNPGLYMLRELILTNSIFKLLDIINISVSSKTTWVLYSNILTHCEDIVIIVLLGVMIFRNDERSLHDIICKTNVIEVKNTN